MTNSITTQQQAQVMTTPVYDIQRDATGKYTRKAMYDDYNSFTVESKEDKIWLMGILNDGEGEDNGVIGMKDAIGAEFEIENIIRQAYDKLDENTGQLSYGVLTHLFSTEKDENGRPVVYVTSSKSVHHTLDTAFKLFGTPGMDNYVGLKVKVIKQKGRDHDIVNLKIIG